MRKLAVKWKIPARYLFSIDGVAYFLPEAEAFGADAMQRLPEGVGWQPLELFRTARPREAAFAAVTGFQLAESVPDAALLSAVRAQDGTR